MRHVFMLPARAGFGGIALSFLNYTDELGHFAQEVLPRLDDAGVRLPPGEGYKIG